MSSTGTLEAGTVVAERYRIEESLGGEGASAVYRATDLRLERAVGLRALAPADGAQQGRAAARLVHPNVARVLDFGPDAALGVEFVVADLGTGGSLASLLAQRGTPPLQLASRIVQEAAAGMAAAHRAGLVHGDLHPGVLWLSRDEGRLRVQVLGLGLNPGGAPPSRATARYASPERLRRARELAPAADVFSLGVVAYEVFAGLPAEWTSLLLSMARGQAVIAPSLLDARPDLPAHVAQAVRRALLADPAQRWPDAGELAAHLIAESAAAPVQPAAPAPVVAAPEPITAASFAAHVAEAAASETETVEAVASEPEAVEAAAPVSVADAAPSAEAQPVAVVAPIVTEQAMEPVAAVEPIAEPVVAAVVEDAVPVAQGMEVAAEPVPAPAVAPPAPKRQPQVQRAKPITAAKTDLADSLYIPPALTKAAPAPRVEAAPPILEAAAVAPQPQPEPKRVEAQPVLAAAEPVATAQVVEEAPASPIVPVLTPVVSLVPATPAAAQSVAVVPDAGITMVAIPERRRRPMTLGQPAGGQRRGLLAASIAVAVLVVGAVVARTVLAGPADVPVPVAQGLASPALAAVGAARGPAQPQQALADPVAPLPAVDSAARAALTPEERKRLDEERRKLEEQRRLQQRQRDSLRAAQQLAAQQQAAPQQVALAAAPRAVESAPAPQIEQRAAASTPAATEAGAPPAAAPARPRADANRVYGGGEVDQPPSLANGTNFRAAVNRSYPSILRSSGQWGNAMVTFTVGVDGRVERGSISVDQASHPAFRSAATSALAAARFNPARVDGQPVRAQVSMPITWQGTGERDED